MIFVGEKVGSSRKGGFLEDDGFILPYVLFLILTLSIIILISFERIQSSTNVISKIKQNQSVEEALDEAEKTLLFMFLSNAPVAGGINLNTTAPLDPFENMDVSEYLGLDLWRGNGGMRQVQTNLGPVIIIYQDSQGLVPLNSGNQNLISELLKSFGASSEKAKSLSAKLGDYIDEDTERQFRGGERQLYRLHSLPPPSNEPLKNYGELHQILEWSDIVQSIDFYAFMKQTTLDPHATYIKKAFAKDSLLERLKLNTATSSTPTNNSLIDPLSDNEPSKRARFMLFFQQDGSGVTERIIELERTLNDPVKPFNKYWIGEFKHEGEADFKFGEVASIGDSWVTPTQQDGLERPSFSPDVSGTGTIEKK